MPLPEPFETAIRYWSDDQDGSGFNALGLQLMLLRERLAGDCRLFTIQLQYPTTLRKRFTCEPSSSDAPLQETSCGPPGWPSMWTCAAAGRCPVTCSGSWP